MHLHRAQTHTQTSTHSKFAWFMVYEWLSKCKGFSGSLVQPTSIFWIWPYVGALDTRPWLPLNKFSCAYKCPKCPITLSDDSSMITANVAHILHNYTGLEYASKNIKVSQAVGEHARFLIARIISQTFSSSSRWRRQGRWWDKQPFGFVWRCLLRWAKIMRKRLASHFSAWI